MLRWLCLLTKAEFVNRSDYDKYKIIKEKTIGKTLEVECVELFFGGKLQENIDDKDTKIFLKNKKKIS